MPAVAGQQDGPQSAAPAEVVHGREQPLDHVAVVGVADLRTVERDAGHTLLVEIPQNGLIGHGAGLRFRLPSLG
jgi:hypothetical protein